MEIWTDGGCIGNPGKGGWSYVIATGGEPEVGSGKDGSTTNNRMEMAAVIEALERVEPQDSLLIRSDSQYVVKGWSEWLKGWLRSGKKVKNADLWDRLRRAATRHGKVELAHVKGHAGNEMNERADAVANAAARSAFRDEVTPYANAKAEFRPLAR